KDVTDWINRVAKKRIQTVSGVGEVGIIGGVNRQVRVNIEPYKLQSMGLSINDIVNAIKNADIGTVEDGQEQYNSLTLVNGKRAIGLDIRPAEKANVVDVSDGVYDMIKQINKIKPADVEISVTYDQTQSTRMSLKNVEQTLFEGAVLTILIVFIFLKSWRSTVITGLTLPIALIGTIFAIYVLGFTLNAMSLMAL